MFTAYRVIVEFLDLLAPYNTGCLGGAGDCFPNEDEAACVFHAIAETRKVHQSLGMTYQGRIKVINVATMEHGTWFTSGVDYGIIA